MASIVESFDHRFYPKLSWDWDHAFMRQEILSQLTPQSVVLDLGAGAGIKSDMNFKGSAARVCGIDLDPRVMTNPMLDESKIADVGAIPYPDATFDLVFSNSVFEHLAEPLVVFKEVARVLKPGGRFIIKTPNKWHYVPTIARLTSHTFHKYYNALRGRAEADTFPTLYRANSAGDIRNLATRAGLKVAEIRRIEGRPEYLRLNPATYLAGVAYERIVNSTEKLAFLRVVLIARLTK